MHFVVRLKAGQEFLGMAGLHNIGASESDTGIWIKEAMRGNGYGREAVTALIFYNRSGLLRLLKT